MTTTSTLQVHARMHRAPPQALISILLLASMLLVISSAEPPPSYRFDLIHVDANGNFTREELIRRAASRTCLREATLSPTDSNAVASSTKCSGVRAADAIFSQHEYLMELQIGTPAKPFTAVADTGSGLTWIKDDAKRRRCNKSASKSFTSTTCPNNGPGCRTCSKDGLCVFEKNYGTGSTSAKGFMGTDVLTFPKEREGLMKRIWNFVTKKKSQVEIPIGCVDCGAHNCRGLLPEAADGLLGLSRSGIKSLWEKLKPIKVSKFSYCLSSPIATPKDEGRSHLWFGGDCLALPSGGGEQTTPLVQVDTILPAISSESLWATRYYVELLGISIGKSTWSAVSETKQNQGNSLRSKGGNPLMFLDSGLSFSILESHIFQELVKLLEHNGLKISTAEEHGKFTCFEGVTDENTPPMILKFSGAEMSLPRTSYMIEQKDGSLFCLAFVGTDKKLKASGLGNFQQQNIHMLYDPNGNKLSFVRVPHCSQL